MCARTEQKSISNDINVLNKTCSVDVIHENKYTTDADAAAAASIVNSSNGVEASTMNGFHDPFVCNVVWLQSHYKIDARHHISHAVADFKSNYLPTKQRE